MPENSVQSSLESKVFTREIGELGNGNGPVLLVIAGLHGNERSGVLACERILADLDSVPIRGKIIFLAGNVPALQANVRMFDTDLNRVWSLERVEKDLLSKEALVDDIGAEASEFKDLNRRIHALSEAHPELVLIDLHTTSSQTVPFVTMCDTLVNRKFVRGLGVPVVIGIEEYLKGPLLAYLMERGHLSIAFESGSHYDPGSANRHYHFLHLALEKAGLLSLTPVNRKHHLEQIAFSPSLSNAVFDVRYRHLIEPNEEVTVLPGFKNFDIVQKGQKLAQQGNAFLLSDRHCRIFMPLYQSKGEEAYFLIGRMPAWWKYLSRFARKNRMDKLVTLAPGITRVGANHLSVEPGVAKSWYRLMLHLVGYRFLHEVNEQFVYIRREHTPA